MPDIFEQLVKELKMTVISELNKLAAIFTGVDINKCDLSDKEGLANLICEWLKKYLGVSNSDNSDNSDKFLVPGLTTPSLLSGEANNSTQMLTLKNTKDLVKDLKNAKKTFEEIPGGEINYEHRYQTLLYLEELISLLKNILKAMEQIKKLCPLHSGSEKLYKLLQNLINCFNRLILFCDQKVPSALNTEGVKKKFYEENLKKIEQITVQGLKKLAEENLKKYYKSWGVRTDHFNESNDPPYEFSIAKEIFNTIEDLNKQLDGRWLNWGRDTPQRDVRINSHAKLPLKATPNPIDPQEKLGENPFVFDYETWFEIYKNTSDDDVKKTAEEKVEKMVSNKEGTSQIKDIACGIKKLSNQTKSKLIKENGCALIEFLHESLDIREESTKSAKKTTLSDLQKLASNLISKATNTFDSMKKLKKKSQTKLPLLKVKNVKDDNEEINKMKELLDYNFDSPKEPPTYELTINSKTNDLLKIKDNKINLKQFLENISDKFLLILRSNDNNEQKISNFETIIKATLYFFDLTDIWQSQVKELLKQLDTSNIPEDDTIIYTAKMYMDIHKKIISSDSKLKSIANKIKLLRKIKFNKKELINLCNELVESIDQQTTDEKTIKETSEHLKKYTEMSGLFKEYYPLIKKYPKHYANFTKTYKELNGDKRALAQKEKIEKIYPIFKNYMLNIDNHSDLYNKTYQPNSKFLEEILELTLILKDLKLKIKAQSLLNDLKTKFNNGGYSKTPEEYIELTQKIDKLRQKVNEKLYNNMRNYKDENKSNFTDTEMSQLMNEVDKSIKSDTDNLEQYQTFIKISNRLTI